MTVFILLGYSKSSLGSCDECRLSAKWLPTPSLGCEVAFWLPPSTPLHPWSCLLLLLTTQSGSWYLFYHPTEGRRL